MKKVLYVLPLKEWTDHKGVVRKSQCVAETHAHGCLSKSVTLRTGVWNPVDDPGSKQFARVLQRQNTQEDCPDMQRYELEIREEPDETDDLASALPDIPVIRLAKSVDEKVAESKQEEPEPPKKGKK